MRHRATAIGGFAITAATLSLLAAGCAGGSSPGVANVGSSTTAATTTQSTAHPSAVDYTSCMRSHGVPAFPDPTSGGEVPKVSLQQVGVSSSEFQAAQTTCLHLLPNGGRPTQAQVQQYRSTMLIYAQCIRTHGVPNMPDPNSRGHLNIGPGSDVDVNSPKFQAAFQACKSKLSP